MLMSYSYYTSTFLIDYKSSLFYIAEDFHLDDLCSFGGGHYD